MDTIDLPPSWRRATERILAGNWRKILVIGATDRGKSTFCRSVSQALLEAGRSVALVDADVGQKDIGPPATVTLGYPEGGGDLGRVGAAALYFVGSVNPAGLYLPLLVGTRRLVDAAGAAFVLINTVGMIHGRGRELKGYQIESLEPDVVVAIEKGGELEAILRPYRHHRIIRIPPSPLAVAKSPAQRKRNRERAWQRYFSGAGEVTLSLDRLILQRTLLLTGRPVQDERFVYAEKTAEGLLAVSEAELPHQSGLTVLPAGFEQGLLCGLADRHNLCLGLATLRRIDFDKGAVSLLTPVPGEKIRVVQFGTMHVRPDGTEMFRNTHPHRGSKRGS